MTHQLQQQLWMGTQRAADCSFCDSCILPQKHVIVVIWQHNCTETAKVEFTKLGDMDNESKGSTSCYLSGKRSLALAENALSKYPASREWSHNKKNCFQYEPFCDVNHFRVELDICGQNWKQNKILFALVMSAFCLFRFYIVLMHTIPLLRLNYSAESVQPIDNPTPSSAFISVKGVLTALGT